MGRTGDREGRGAAGAEMGTVCGRQPGVQQARVSASRPGQRAAGWGGGSGQGLERYSVSRAVTRNEEGREETGKGLACQREAMDLITLALRNLKDDQCRKWASLPGLF